MSWYNQDNNTSRGNWEKEDRNVETVWNEDIPTEEVTLKRDEVPTMPSSKKSRSREESGEAARTEFQSKRDKWRSYHEQSPDTPTMEKFKGRPRGAKASFWENKIETMGDDRRVTSSAIRLREMTEEIRRSRKPWSSSADLNTKVGDTEEETPTIKPVIKCRPRGARASFWENKICSMETEAETVDHRRENAHKQKMEEEILRFRRPWREIMRDVGVTDEVSKTSGQDPSEPSDSSSDEEKALSDSEPDDSKKSFQKQTLSDSSDDEEYYARIDEMKRQAKLKKELSDDEMDETIATELENLDINDFPKKPDDSMKSYQEQALSDSSDDEEYYARIDEMKRQAKLKKELSDDEMDETIATELENLDINDYPKKPDDSKKSDQLDAEKRNSSQSCATVTEKKPAPQKSEEVAEHKTRVEIYKVTEKSAPQQSPDTDELETSFEVPEAKGKQAAPEQYQEKAEQKAQAEVSQATEKSVAEQAAETVEQKTSAEVPHILEEKCAAEPIADIHEQKSPAEVPQDTEKSTPEQSAAIHELETPCEVPQSMGQNSDAEQSPEVVEPKAAARDTHAITKMSSPEQSAYTDEQKTTSEGTQAMEKKPAPVQSEEIAEQKPPTEVPQVTEKSVPEQSAHKTEQKTSAEVSQSSGKTLASVQPAEIAGPKTLAEFIAEVPEVTEKNPAPLQSANIGEPKTSAELPEAMEKNSSFEHFGEMAEQKNPLEVPIGTEKQSAPEQYALMATQKSTAKVPCATKSESCPEKFADAVNQKITVETSSDTEKIVQKKSAYSFQRMTTLEVPTKDFAQPKSDPVEINIDGTRANGSSSKEDENIAEPINCAYEENKVHGHPAERSTRRNDDIVELNIVVAQTDAENSKSGNNAEVKDRKTVSSVPKCPEVLNESFAQLKSDLIQTVIDGTRADGNDGNIAELLKFTNEEDEAHVHPDKSSPREDCDSVGLDISIAQSDAPNSKSEHTASADINTADLKAGKQNCIIQENLQKEVITHSEIITQDCYNQPDEDVEVFYDAVSAVEGKDTYNQEKKELEEKHLPILAKTQLPENFKDEEEAEIEEEIWKIEEEIWKAGALRTIKTNATFATPTVTSITPTDKVSRRKQVLKKVGLAAIGISCAVGGLYLLYTNADDDTVRLIWNTASKILPFVEPMPEPEPEKSFLFKMLDYFIPPPPPPEPEKYFLWKLLDNLPSLPCFR